MDIDFKSQVLAATDLVELIGRTVVLKRRGRNYVGLCPFHSEKTGSFTVDSVKQFFICYGCKEHGNAIDFVMKRDRIEFIEALRMLGESCGLEMPRLGLSKQKSSERQGLLEMQSAAGAFFEKLLSDAAAGKVARTYLSERGINEESIRRFHIGVAADGWDALVSGPVGRKFGPAQLVTGGLAKARDNGGGFYDTFRNRLMFPIRDENSKVIAFGGRVLPGSTDPAKYLNSPETPLFTKSKCLFGIDQARQKIVDTRTAVVVEGYTDVIMAHQFGVSNVVAPLGTALTEQHIGLLRRFADRIVLLFDADGAGDSATDRAVELFLTQPIEILVGTMPQGTDPDEYLLEHGAAGFEQVLAEAQDALSYQWKRLQRQFDASADDLTARQKLVQTYLERLAKARGTGPVDAIRWGQALSRVSRLTEVPVETLQKQFSARSAAVQRMRPVRPQGAAEVEAKKAPSGPSRPRNARERAERQILGVLLEAPKQWKTVQFEVSPQDFESETHRRLAEVYWECQREEGEPVFNEFLDALRSEPGLVELAIGAREDVVCFSDLNQTLSDAVAHVRHEKTLGDAQRKLVAAARRTEGQRLTAEEEVTSLQKLAELANRRRL